MKNIKVISLILAICLTFPCLFTSCGKEYRDDVALSELRSEVEALIPTEYGYRTLSADYFNLYIKAPEGVDEYVIVQSNAREKNINEFGIFKVDDGEHITGVKKALESYIVEQQKDISFIDTYAPAESPKLKNASVRVFGEYVVYLILDSETQDTAYEKLESKLQK